MEAAVAVPVQVAPAAPVRRLVVVSIPHSLMLVGCGEEYPQDWIGEVVPETEYDRVDSVVRERLSFVKFGRHFSGLDREGRRSQKTELIKGIGIGMYVPNWLLNDVPAEEKAAN